MSFSKLVKEEQSLVEQKLVADTPKPSWQENEKTFSQVFGKLKILAKNYVPF